MTDATSALQAAMYTALVGHQPLMDIITGVHDYTPDQKPFPYVQFGTIDAVDFGTKTFDGHEHTVELHVWSRERGRRQAYQIMGLIYAVLHRAQLVLTGHHLVLLRFDYQTTLWEPDGKTAHGIIRFRSLSQVTT